MPAPRWLARFNLHATNRVLGPLALRMPGMGVLVHIGRTTRRVYRTPVMVFRRGNHFLIALTYGRESQWVQNVIAQNRCELQTEGRTVQLVDPYLFHDEKQRAMPRFVRFVLGLLNVSDFLELAVRGGAQGSHGEKGNQSFEGRKSA
jgi:deazaflavin-dependent oxidoreductase (nitroreductase family)